MEEMVFFRMLGVDQATVSHDLDENSSKLKKETLKSLKKTEEFDENSSIPFLEWFLSQNLRISVQSPPASLPPGYRGTLDGTSVQSPIITPH